MQLETRTLGDILVVELAGRLDSYTAAEACDRIVAFGSVPVRRVVLVLARLDYINSSGLTAILVCARQQKARGGEVVIAEARGVVAAALETAGFDSLIRMVGSEAEAISEDSPPAPPESP